VKRSTSIPPLVIACGDHAGIGPEVTLKAIAAESANLDLPGFVLIGDAAELNRLRDLFHIELDWSPYPGHPAPPTSNLLSSSRTACPIWLLDGREPAPAQAPETSTGHRTAQDALAYLRRAATGCLQGEFSGLVTAPVSKETILRSGVHFVGQTEFLAEMAGVPDVTMMLLGDDAQGRWLRVALVTTHLPLRDVADAITPTEVTRAIRHASDACQRLGLPRARVGVAGLNPHAGEGGMLGDEELRVIHPGIEAARRLGFDVAGPIAGDTLFHQALRGDFDAVVAMYHDQGLAPLKLVAFDRGVNWSLGLPFVRTSPDHGTAFNIAGQGIADPSSMRAAIQMACQLANP
jgi:4-hydroxythreonine-4-phosphate dehydrogenase